MFVNSKTVNGNKINLKLFFMIKIKNLLPLTISLFVLTVNTAFQTIFMEDIHENKTGIKYENGNWDATYYGNNYRTTRYTANGDKFNMNAMTCAAPKFYKFGTKLKVTNINNGKSVIVTVTDRGGFGNRTIDLTYGAFGKIADHRLGRIKVKVQIVN